MMNRGSHGFHRVVDQVARREAFERRFPHVAIQFHGKPDFHWTAQWQDPAGPAEEHGVQEHTITRPELRQLLDALNAAVG